MKKRPVREWRTRGIPISIAVGVVLALGVWSASRLHKLWTPLTLTKEKLAEVLGSSATFHRYPTELDLQITGEEAPIKVQLEYTFDSKLQATMEGLFRSYSPDYGAFVAMDARTGRVLSLVSFSRGSHAQENLALRSTFPSASVFKVVTAAAAIEKSNYSANTVIPYNGRNHTLYRSNILKNQITRWTRYITLKDAFAQSINTVFGKIGAFTVGAQELREYADRFGFNRRIASELPMQAGQASIPDDLWGIAESASGFTRENTMSPLQGALIASTIVNDGEMVEPYVVKRITRVLNPLEAQEAGATPPVLYEATLRPGAHVVSATTAQEIRSLMRETVRKGTSRGSFRGFFKRDLAELEVGGKTGSLTGKSPKGKYDWFVGYAQDPRGERKIAIAALTIHERLWRVKSSYLARRAIEVVFKD